MGRKDIVINSHLISCSYHKNRTSFKWPEETYDQWTILTCDEGRFHYRVADKSGQVTVGEIVLCPPGETLHRKALSTISFYFIAFHLDTHLDESPANFPYRGKLTFQRSSRLLSTLVHLRESEDSGLPSYREHLLNDILYQLMGEDAAKRKKEHTPQSTQIVEAVRYIAENAFSNISMHSVARQIGLSQSQFTRKFKNEMGITPTKHLTKLRLQRCQMLLTETNQSLENIAEQCGYQNAFYLSRIFSKEMDISPSLYRKFHKV